MPNDVFLTDLKDGIYTITINRPDRLNALTDPMLSEFAEIFRRVNLDDNIRCVVVTAAGNYFCAGADLSAFAAREFSFEQPEFDLEENENEFPASHLAHSIVECLKPVIGAVNGAAIGIGATMLLPMDFRLAIDSAKIGFVFTRRGLVPEAACTWLLPRIVGLPKASDWLVTGRIISAQEALEAGLVSALYKPEELLPAAYAIARDIVENTSSLSVAMTRQLLMQNQGASSPKDVTLYEAACVHYIIQSPEVLEGVQSLLEKRQPKFPGKVSKNLPSFFHWWNKR